MNYKIITLGILFFLLSIPCNAQTVPQKSSENQAYFDEDQLLQHIKILSSDEFEGRRTGTRGSTKAREYIINQFQKLKVFPLGKTFEQDFTFTSGGKMYNGVNVLGFVKGTDFPYKYIVISAHYDHEGIQNGEIYNGADDDASGVSALFAFAEYFKNNPPKHSVILAAFDSEELGLKGSKYFVNNSIVPLYYIQVNLNMDMISRSDKNELFAVGTCYNATLKNLILNFNQSEKLSLLTGHDGKDGKENWTNSSDHGSFHKKKIPFLYFGVEDHKDYHRPTDDYENIHPEFFIEAVNVIISVFRKLDVIQLKK
ncbi:MAG: M28 family peptidase [Bacteroidetes bacterium]|nr:M28 family peptidase [Bacteroidota bacterium]